MKNRTWSPSGFGRGSRRLHVIYPERRREKRYMTLKTAGIAGFGVVVAFLLLSVWSAFRPHSGASGNLFPSPAPASDSTSAGHDPGIVSEGSIYDHPGTDPLLLDAGALDQLRPVAAAPVASPPSTTAEQMNFENRPSQLGTGQRITISGGSEGVQVQVQAQPIPPPKP